MWRMRSVGRIRHILWYNAHIITHKAWYEHVLRKRKGEASKRPIADVMIGSYALQKGGLITRTEDDFRSLYPTLNIYNPVTANN